MLATVLINIMAITFILWVAMVGLTLGIAFELGGEFYIGITHAYRKGLLERILDGLETLKRM